MAVQHPSRWFLRDAIVSMEATIGVKRDKTFMGLIETGGPVGSRPKGCAADGIVAR